MGLEPEERRPEMAVVTKAPCLILLLVTVPSDARTLLLMSLFLPACECS